MGYTPKPLVAFLAFFFFDLAADFDGDVLANDASSSFMRVAAPSTSRRSPPGRAVRISTPSSVTISVCSNCAVKQESVVVTVQSSSQKRPCGMRCVCVCMCFNFL